MIRALDFKQKMTNILKNNISSPSIRLSVFSCLLDDTGYILTSDHRTIFEICKNQKRSFF